MFMRKKVSILLLSLIVALPTSASTTKIYVWVNEKGQLVYSDTPKPGAEEVKVKSNQNVISSIKTSELSISPQKTLTQYKIEITQPEHEATVRDNTGSVYISGRVMPRFKRGLKVQLYLDNKPYEQPSTKSVFILRNVHRGEHIIKMELVDQKGKVIASSEPRTFYMHRASIIKAK